MRSGQVLSSRLAPFFSPNDYGVVNAGGIFAFFCGLGIGLGTVTVVASFQNMAVVCELEEKRGSRLCISETQNPSTEAGVGGDDRACGLLELAQERGQQRATGCRFEQIRYSSRYKKNGKQHKKSQLITKCIERVWLALFARMDS